MHPASTGLRARRPNLALLLAFAILIAAPVAAAPAAVNPRLIRVELSPTLPLSALLGAGLDVIEVRGTAYANVYEWPGDEAILMRLGARVTLLNADPARTYAERAARELAGRPRPAGKRVWSATGTDGIASVQALPPFGSGSMGGYWTLDEVKMKLDDLVASDVNDVVADKIDTLGYSALQNRPIWGLKICKSVVGPDTRPVVFYNSLTHSREPEGMQALLYFVDDVLAMYGSDPTATYLLDNRVIYIVPVVNPDGYRYNQTTNPGGGGLWRKNLRDNNGNAAIDGSDGVDINRNYGYQWGFDNIGSSPSAGSPTYRGPSAFSESETRAQRDIVVALKPISGLSNHTHSDLLIHPWGFTTTAPPDSNTFYEWEDDMTLGNGYLAGAGPRILYSVNGEFNDWVYGDVALKPRGFTWTPEIGGPSDGFWPPPSRILPIAQDVLRIHYWPALIAGPFVRVDKAEVTDGPLAAGFNYHLAVRARNKGATGNAGPNLSGTLYSLSAGASVFTGPLAYPTLGPLTSGDALGGATYMVAVDDTVTPGRLLRFGIDFKTPDPGGLFSRDTVELVSGVPTIVAADGASAGLGQWTPGSWGIIANDAGHTSRYFADSPAGAYPNNTDNLMTLTAPLNLSAGVHAYALFEARWQFESDYDYGAVEASLNGTTWTPVPGTGTSRGVLGGVQPSGQPIYDGARQLWGRTERADLSNFTGPAASAVRLRFRARSDPGSRLAGMDVDSLRVLLYDPAVQPATVAVGETPAPQRLALYLATNVVRGEAAFRFSLPASGAARLDIFDLQGRNVATVVNATLPGGEHTAEWSARDGRGHAAPVGVYLARLSLGGETTSLRLILLSN